MTDGTTPVWDTDAVIVGVTGLMVTLGVIDGVTSD